MVIETWIKPAAPARDISPRAAQGNESTYFNVAIVFFTRAETAAGSGA